MDQNLVGDDLEEQGRDECKQLQKKRGRQDLEKQPAVKQRIGNGWIFNGGDVSGHLVDVESVHRKVPYQRDGRNHVSQRAGTRGDAVNGGVALPP